MLLPIIKQERIKVLTNKTPRAFEIAFLHRDGSKSQKKSDPAKKSVSADDVKKTIKNHKQADILFVVDTTGSMKPAIDAVQEVIRDTAKSISNDFERRMVKFGLVAYRDRIADQEQMGYITKIIQPFTDDVHLFEKKLASTSVASVGSEDHPEAFFDGVALGLSDQLKWREHGFKFMIMIGDAPSHILPERNPHEYTVDKLVGMNKKNIFFYALQITGMPDHDKVHQDQLTALLNENDAAVSAGVQLLQSRDPKVDKSKFLTHTKEILKQGMDRAKRLNIVANWCSKNPVKCKKCKTNPGDPQYQNNSSKTSSPSFPPYDLLP